LLDSWIGFGYSGLGRQQDPRLIILVVVVTTYQDVEGAGDDDGSVSAQVGAELQGHEAGRARPALVSITDLPNMQLVHACINSLVISHSNIVLASFFCSFSYAYNTACRPSSRSSTELK
jgi:hypothetical protein